MKISAVIIARNEEESVRKTIRLIRAQNYPKERIEIIVVSDGSKDNTVKNVLQESVKVIVLEKSYGISVARNIGVLESAGEVIFFIDAHIFINKNAFRFLSKRFNQYSDICGICGKYHTPFNRLDSIRNIRYEALSGKNKMPRIINLDNFATFSSGIGAFRRNLFDRVGLFKEDFRGFAGEDIFFELQILDKDISLYFDPRINGLHYEKVNNFRSLYSRILKDVRGFSKIVVSGADFSLKMPKIDRYYLHFPFLLVISLILSILRVEFIPLFLIAIIFEMIFIKDIWFLRDYDFKEKMLAVIYSLCIAFLKIFFVPVFIFRPTKLFINERIKAIVIDENRNKTNKSYKFENGQSIEHYIPTIIKRVRYVLKLFFRWEIMKIITVSKFSAKPI